MNDLIGRAVRASQPTGVPRHRVPQTHLRFEETVRLSILNVSAATGLPVTWIIEECTAYALPLVEADPPKKTVRLKPLPIARPPFTPRLNPELSKSVSELATRCGVSVSHIIRQCVTIGLPRWEAGIAEGKPISAVASACADAHGETERPEDPLSVDPVESNEQHPQQTTALCGLSKPRRRCENTVPESVACVSVRQSAEGEVAGHSSGDVAADSASARPIAGVCEAEGDGISPPDERQNPVRDNSTDRASSVGLTGEARRDAGTHAPVVALLQERKRDDEAVRHHEHQGNLAYRAQKDRPTPEVQECLIKVALEKVGHGNFTYRDVFKWFGLPTSRENISRVNAWCESMARACNTNGNPRLKRVHKPFESIIKRKGWTRPVYRVLTDEERLSWERECRKYGVFGFPKGTSPIADTLHGLGDINWM